MNRTRGYTLIELLIVVVIIGIVTAVALVTYRPSVRKEADDVTADVKTLNALFDRAVKAAKLKNTVIGLNYTTNSGFQLSEYREKTGELATPSSFTSFGNPVLPLSEVRLQIDHPLQWRHTDSRFQAVAQGAFPLILVYPDQTIKPNGAFTFISRSSGDVRTFEFQNGDYRLKSNP